VRAEYLRAILLSSGLAVGRSEQVKVCDTIQGVSMHMLEMEFHFCVADQSADQSAFELIRFVDKNSFPFLVSSPTHPILPTKVKASLLKKTSF
jgi:hypothetical protein